MTAGKVMVEGTPDEVLNNREVQEAYLGSQYR
jgi:ABC-type branched-subunit amino acid transport system ATPase component